MSFSWNATCIAGTPSFRSTRPPPAASRSASTSRCWTSPTSSSTTSSRRSRAERPLEMTLLAGRSTASDQPHTTYPPARCLPTHLPKPLPEALMPRSSRYILAVVLLFGIACQHSTTNISSSLSPPQNLGYQLDASGDPNTPAGILLVWDDVLSSDLASYRVYSRASTSGSFLLRGGESDFSNIITVDERLRLQAPDTLGSISLNQAIHLGWADNAAQDTTFKWYRVYSASYNLDTGVCGADWSLEGETVSNEFLATLLVNGTPRCFGVSAISKRGYESLWSPLRQDTPRPDARNVLVYALEQQPAQAGFRF